MSPDHPGIHIMPGGAGMIVATYTFGETKVHICDDQLVTDPDERERVEIAIADAAWACLQDKAEQE